MSQNYLARIAALEDALRQKDSQLSLVAETGRSCVQRWPAQKRK
jgi:hypothetical protein